MYRLLFLFYIESRPDLGYAPMGSDVYRLGYSLESLRDMDSAELGSEEDKESTYISDSLDRLFQMIWEGYPKRDDETAQLPLADGGGSLPRQLPADAAEGPSVRPRARAHLESRALPQCGAAGGDRADVAHQGGQGKTPRPGELFAAGHQPAGGGVRGPAELPRLLRRRRPLRGAAGPEEEDRQQRRRGRGRRR